MNNQRKFERSGGWLSLYLGLTILALLLVSSVAAQTAAPKISEGEDLPVPGKPVAADHAKL
jgi:hypothetical protein